MKNGICWIEFDLLERFMIDVFRRVGIPKHDAEICADVLITSDKRGIDSHGIGRFKPIYIDRIKLGIVNPVTNMEIVKESPATAVVDGHNGMGQVIAKKSMQMAIKKAKKYGMGMVAVRNSNHYGIAGYYALMATDSGMLGITGSNARPSVAPTFGIENMLGTNPLTIGFPTDEDFPFIIDCATSISQRGKIEVYARLKKKMPSGWVINKQGKSETNAQQVLTDLLNGDAALVPLGGIGEETSGYKGYGYSTVVEVLSAALQGGTFLKALCGYENGKRVPHRLGHFFMAIDISAFIGLDSFKKTAGDILRTLRASKRMPGQSRIYTAGQKEYEAWLARKVKGAPVDEVLQNQLLELKKEYKLEQYIFPFE